jgi:hypothetical protein
MRYWRIVVVLWLSLLVSECFADSLEVNRVRDFEQSSDPWAKQFAAKTTAEIAFAEMGDAIKVLKTRGVSWVNCAVKMGDKYYLLGARSIDYATKERPSGKETIGAPWIAAYGADGIQWEITFAEDRGKIISSRVLDIGTNEGCEEKILVGNNGDIFATFLTKETDPIRENDQTYISGLKLLQGYARNLVVHVNAAGKEMERLHTKEQINWARIVKNGKTFGMIEGYRPELPEQLMGDMLANKPNVMMQVASFVSSHTGGIRLTEFDENLTQTETSAESRHTGT